MKRPITNERFYCSNFCRTMINRLILAAAAISAVVQNAQCYYGTNNEYVGDVLKAVLEDLEHGLTRRPGDGFKDVLNSGARDDQSYRSWALDTNSEVVDIQAGTDEPMEEDGLPFYHRFFDIKSPASSLLNRNRVGNFLTKYQKELHMWRRKGGLASWNKETNLTLYNGKIAQELSLRISAWATKKRREAQKFSQEGLTYDQKRMLKFILLSETLKEPDLRKKLLDLESRISSVYSQAVVCNDSDGKCYHFEPGLINIFRHSRDYDQLLWAWKGWRDAIGPKIRKDWIEAEKLKNDGAREHGLHNTGYAIRHSYEDPSFEEDIDELWRTLEPFYKELHAFVRYKLRQKYGSRVSLTKPIPAHLLGDMWAMKWDGILDVVQPFPDVEGFAVTQGMKEKNMTVHQMFELADEFYQSLGLPKMTPEFWKYSMFTRPNRPVVCYASAHNLEGNDVRIKMCASVNADYLYVVHHEMGHCQYYLGYNRHQPELYQNGANHGFHEAIGDTAALSVISPNHLIKLGILKESTLSEEDRLKRDLNFLMQKALSKLAFFPFAMTMSKWSWDVSRDAIHESDLNSAWWRYKKLYQGLAAPIERTEHDFDPGSKFHIANFVPYIRYFVSHILQFQFFEALCDHAGYEGPLHRCDIAGSKKAGAKFKKLLDMGSSRPWPQALRELTGTGKMTASSVIRYFNPLLNWLRDENKRLKLKLGWD